MFKPKFKEIAQKREPIPTGQYDARCFGIAELGTITKFNNFKNIEEEVSELILFFEIPELMITWEKDGKETTTPRATYPKFKVSMHEQAKLRLFIEAWFGKSFPDQQTAESFDFAKLIGHTCTLNMEVNEAGYSNIKTISPLHKSVKLEKQHNESINFGLEDINGPEWDKLYPWVQQRVMQSYEYIVQEHSKTIVGESVAEDDDIPF